MNYDEFVKNSMFEIYSVLTDDEYEIIENLIHIIMNHYGIEISASLEDANSDTLTILFTSSTERYEIMYIDRKSLTWRLD